MASEALPTKRKAATSPKRTKQVRNGTVLIFHAARRPNAKGEFNWHEFRTLERKKGDDLYCKALQNIIGGSITLLPHVNGCNAKFVAYGDDNGLLDPDFARNDLAGGTLSRIGFRGWESLGFAYAGTVIVMDQKERGLTQDEQNELTKEIEAYRKSYDEEDEGDE